MVTEVVIKREYYYQLQGRCYTYVHAYISTSVNCHTYMNTSCNLAHTLSHYLHIVLHVMLISVCEMIQGVLYIV